MPASRRSAAGFALACVPTRLPVWLTINLGVRSNMLPIQIGELAIQRAAIAFDRILSVFAAEYKKQNRFNAPSSC